jgi:hypothetical protein
MNKTTFSIAVFLIFIIESQSFWLKNIKQFYFQLQREIPKLEKVFQDTIKSIETHQLFGNFTED